ncbi:alkaline phosphatase [Desulfosarcina alkanivorans]|jgi:alkaline phosphatase|uniref:Alkaline phosphatase n=1 Tax=Desulfosarcina alkanivorans TaxID=571177 RepID=A0A5K7YJ51_9BACT|nr:alkaline phosphatase [Desulfosarcina alkanivorans]BBO68415.1 alkaline phosphatase [Desulfosarcina alkanivorans]
MRFARKILVGASVAAMIGAFSINPALADKYGNRYGHQKRAKNVIVLIPDGCDESVQTLARWYKNVVLEEGDLQVDSMQGGSAKIHMANSIITGSAAAATAFATGHKTTVRFLGVGPRTDDLLPSVSPTADAYAPVASVLEAAKLAGKATGIAVTSRVSHATPAAFACHIEDRGWDNDITEHMVYNNVDVVFGGGARHLISEPYTTTFGETWGAKRTDGQNLMQVLLDRGYAFVDNKEDMAALTSGKVWGLFDDSHLDPEMDRETLHPTQPSLAEMTAKAIELLSQDRDGFFLMVEGSQVDWAGHNNDPAYMLNDFLAFDDAVKAAVDFAERNGNTIVLAFPDHNTGGMTVGNYGLSYTDLGENELLDPLKKMTCSANALVSNVASWDITGIQDALSTYWSIDCSDAVAQEIIDLEPSVGKSYALARVISKHYTAIGWTSHGHDAGTVPVWAYGLDIDGTLDNTELAYIMADAMKVDLDEITYNLYVDIKNLTDNFVIDVANDVLTVGKAVFPLGADYMVVGGRNISLPGLTVYASGDANVAETVYISKKAARILKKLRQI